MISKELLIVVLPKCVEFESFEILKEQIDYMTLRTLINIYELAHLCKEWALKNHERIWTVLDDSNSAIARIHGRERIEMYADTEPEAIFKACQWIMENKQ